MTQLLHEFKDRLGTVCDPEYFIDICEITIEELMDVFEIQMVENMGRFCVAFDIEEGYDDGSE